MRAHSSGVRTGIVVADSLVILCRQHRGHGPSISEGHDREFFPVEKLLDQHLFSCRAEHGLVHRIDDRLACVVTRRRNDHAFALS